MDNISSCPALANPETPAPPAPRRIPRDRTRPAIRYTLEGLPYPTAFEKHRLAAEALFAREAAQ